jgi:carbonic anhydrase
VPIVEGAENAALAPIWAALPSEVGVPVSLADPVDAAALLPDDLSSVAYPGSLTTPPCSEGVAWHVLIEPIELSAEQIAAYRAIHDDTDRPTEPLGERTFEEP